MRGTFEDQKRHSAAGTTALRAVHTRRGRRARTIGLGAALQFRSGLQRRTAGQPHLHRGDHSGAGSILSRGAPLATSIFRYQAAFDFASPGLDSLKTFREQSDSLAKLLAAFFRDKSAAEYSRKFREEHARRYRLVNGRDTTYLRPRVVLAHDGPSARRRVRHAPHLRHHPRPHARQYLPREVDYAEWQTRGVIRC